MPVLQSMNQRLFSLPPAFTSRQWRIDPAFKVTVSDGLAYYDRIIRFGGPSAHPITADVTWTTVGWVGNTNAGLTAYGHDALNVACELETREMVAASGSHPACAGWYHDRHGWIASAYGFEYGLAVQPLPGDPTRWMAYVNEEPVKAYDMSWVDDDTATEPPPDADPFTVFDNERAAMTAAEEYAWNLWGARFGDEPEKWPSMQPLDSPMSDPKAFSMARAKVGA